MLWLWTMQPLTLPCEMPVLPAVIAGDGLAEAILPSAVPTVTFLELPLHLARRRRRQLSGRGCRLALQGRRRHGWCWQDALRSRRMRRSAVRRRRLRDLATHRLQGGTRATARTTRHGPGRGARAPAHEGYVDIMHLQSVGHRIVPHVQIHVIFPVYVEPVVCGVLRGAVPPEGGHAPCSVFLKYHVRRKSIIFR